MLDGNGDRVRTHLHGLFAGSLFVLALFLLWTVPSALGRLVRGEVTWSSITYPAVFSVIVGIGIREALAWHRGMAKTPAAPG